MLNTRFDRTMIPLAGVITETIAFGSALVLLAVMMAVYSIPPTLAILWLPVVVGVTVLFSVALAYPVSLIGLWYPDLRTFVVSAMRTLFFVAPGLVALDQVPEGAQKWLKLNPLTGIFESYRSVLLYGHSPAAWEILYPTVFAAVLLAARDAALPPRAEAVREAGGRMSAHVRAEGVGVEFLFDKQHRLVSPTLARVKARRAGTSSWGLRDIDLEIGPGEAVALVGRSGGGKTTLLRTIAGVFTPDAGTIEVEGRIGALLSVGAGVMSPLTGRENAQLLGVLAGLSVRDARRATPNVQAASGLGKLVRPPGLELLAGHARRLGFATADEANPTILLLDEVHEALDHEYRALVQERAREILAAGGIVVAAGSRPSAARAALEPGALARQGLDRRRRAFRRRAPCLLAVAPEPVP